MDSLPHLLEPVLRPLRPSLQAITHNLPGPVEELAVSLLGGNEACYKTLVRDLVPEPECTKFAISKALGVGIISASAVVKVPQLLKLLQSRSAAGLSFASLALETATYLINLAYSTRQGFPFSTYGEVALIAAQNVAIAALVLHFSGRSSTAAVYVAGLASAGYAMFNHALVPAGALEKLMGFAGLLGIASKLPQIFTVWQQGGTGQLSAFAVFNYLFGSLSRIFTTLQEVDDPIILYGFVAGFLLNAVLAAQMLYYWNSPATATHAKEVGASKSKSKKPAKVANKPVAAATAGASKVGAATGSSSRAKGPTTRRRG